MLTEDTEVFVAGTRGDDDRFGHNFFTIHHKIEWALRKIHRFYNSKASLCPKAFRLFLHPSHELVAIHALGKARKIFHDAGSGKQSAGLLAGEHERRELRASGVERSRPARWAGSDDDNFFHRREKVNTMTRTDKVAKN